MWLWDSLIIFFRAPGDGWWWRPDITDTRHCEKLSWWWWRVYKKEKRCSIKKNQKLLFRLWIFLSLSLKNVELYSSPVIWLKPKGSNRAKIDLETWILKKRPWRHVYSISREEHEILVHYGILAIAVSWRIIKDFCQAWISIWKSLEDRKTNLQQSYSNIFLVWIQFEKSILRLFFLSSLPKK